jgi:hypothetical protein
MPTPSARPSTRHGDISRLSPRRRFAADCPDEHRRPGLISHLRPRATASAPFDGSSLSRVSARESQPWQRWCGSGKISPGDQQTDTAAVPSWPGTALWLSHRLIGQDGPAESAPSPAPAAAPAGRSRSPYRSRTPQRRSEHDVGQEDVQVVDIEPLAVHRSVSFSRSRDLVAAVQLALQQSRRRR